MKELDLGKEKISKLLMKFAIPCVISMLVAALYNIVDQIYIGHIPDIGVYCNAATNVVYPLTLIALAICLLIGDGSASLFSLSLGRKDHQKVNKVVGNSITLQIILFVILTLISLLFKNQILNLFGVTSDSYSYAYDYLSIIAIGFPVYMFGQGLNAIIRADGSPKYAMIATTIGAVFNIIFDPIFIFTLNEGIKGAALATILGQLITAIMTFVYLFKGHNFKLHKNDFILDFKLVKNIASLGIASLITQLSIVIIIAVANNLVKVINDPYYGDTIPLAVIGIVMKAFGIVVSICIGIALGGQPIIGYNYGSGNLSRVKETLKEILLSCTIIGFIAFLCFELDPDILISVFGSGNEAYISYAKLCFRIYLSGIVLTCIIKSSTIFLQSCGSSLKSTILSVSRDVIFFVPLIIIFGLNFGIVGMLWSALFADILSFILTIILLKSELRKMNQQSPISLDEVIGLPDKRMIAKDHLVITISREYGSGGHYVGELLAKKLKLKLYDKEIINQLIQSGQFSKQFLTQNDERNTSIGGAEYHTSDKLFIAESNLIKELAKNPCIIVGRCADYILENNPNVFKIFLYSNDENKIKRGLKHYQMKKQNVQETITKMNQERAKYYEHYTLRKWMNPNNYDIMINVDALGVENTANSIKDMLK